MAKTQTISFLLEAKGEGEPNRKRTSEVRSSGVSHWLTVWRNERLAFWLTRALSAIDVVGVRPFVRCRRHTQPEIKRANIPETVIVAFWRRASNRCVGGVAKMAPKQMCANLPNCSPSVAIAAASAGSLCSKSCSRMGNWRLSLPEIKVVKLLWKMESICYLPTCWIRTGSELIW